MPPSSDPPPAKHAAPLPVTTLAEARAAIGQRVSLVGKAQRTKLAPSVQGAALHVYCLGLEAFGAGVEGEQVEVRGVLEYSSDFADVGSPPGEIRQGTGSPVWVLRECSVHVMSRD